MKKLPFLFATLSIITATAQKLPQVNFNHLYVVIDSADIAALRASAFFTKQFAVTVTRTTKANGGEHWTGTYLEGLDNYLELFDNKGFGEPVGNSGIGFSVDGIDDLSRLDAALSKKFATETKLREKQLDDGSQLPWFNGLGIKDAAFDSLSHIWFWVMEYKPEYFDHYHWKHDGHKLTRTTYLSQYATARKGKLLRRFTGATFKATDLERKTWVKFLLACGYKKVGADGYASPENFIIRLTPRNGDDHNTLAALDFETSWPKTGSMKIGPRIRLQFGGSKGKMIFN